MNNMLLECSEIRIHLDSSPCWSHKPQITHFPFAVYEASESMREAILSNIPWLPDLSTEAFDVDFYLRSSFEDKDKVRSRQWPEPSKHASPCNQVHFRVAGCPQTNMRGDNMCCTPCPIFTSKRAPSPYHQLHFEEDGLRITLGP